MRRFISFFWLGLTIVTASNSARGFLRDFKVPLIPDWNRPVRYLVPNERNPQLAKSLYSLAPPGVCISVGLERSFILYALASHCTHLVLIDHDPMLIRAAKINLELLRASQSREDYAHLRIHAPAAEWNRRVVHSDDNDWYWWNAMIRRANGMERFHYHSSGDFEKANYLFEDPLYFRLKAAADEDRIRPFHMSFADWGTLERLAKALRQEERIISIVDFSNLWWNQFLGPKNLDTTLHALSPALTPKSVVVLTGRGDTDRQSRYWGYSIERLRQTPLHNRLHEIVLPQPLGASVRDAALGTFDGSECVPVLAGE